MAGSGATAAATTKGDDATHDLAPLWARAIARRPTASAPSCFSAWLVVAQCLLLQLALPQPLCTWWTNGKRAWRARSFAAATAAVAAAAAVSLGGGVGVGVEDIGECCSCCERGNHSDTQVHTSSGHERVRGDPVAVAAVRRLRVTVVRGHRSVAGSGSGPARPRERADSGTKHQRYNNTNRVKIK